MPHIGTEDPLAKAFDFDGGTGCQGEASALYPN